MVEEIECPNTFASGWVVETDYKGESRHISSMYHQNGRQLAVKIDALC